MPYKEKQIEKVYYSIGEVADMFELSTSNIRFWEKEFKILKPRKNRKGDRLFTQSDIKNLKTIHFLVKEKGYTIKGAKQKLEAKGNKVIDKQEMVMKLEALKGFLSTLSDEL